MARRRLAHRRGGLKVLLRRWNEGSRSRTAGEICRPRASEVERQQCAIEAAQELGVEHTEQVRQASQAAWEKIRAHRGGAAA